MDCARMSGRKQPSFDCSLCGVTTSTEHAFNLHLRGKRHRVHLDRKNESVKHIYVRKFPRSMHITSDLLSELFGTYGSVENVYINQSKDTYAVIKFNKTESATAALQHPPSLEGKPLVVKPRELKLPAWSKKPPMEVQKDEPRLPLSGNHLQTIQQADSINDQIFLLSDYGSISQATSTNHIAFCKLLFSHVKLIFPSSIMLPFGSLITGHGTTTSDCDVTVITSPSPHLRDILSPKNYFPQHLQLQALQALGSTIPEASCTPITVPVTMPITVPMSTPVTVPVTTPTTVPMSTPITVPMSTPVTLPMSTPVTLPMTTPTTVSPHSDCDSSSSSSVSTPERGDTKELKTQSPEFEKLERLIRSLPDCEHVFAIRGARCPIIRFYHSPTTLHVDLSIDNRLGPLNSRLMRAYSECDSRLVPVIRTARLWMRWATKRKVNSYVVSLMVIYSLQRTTPPVLPCLQNVGAWPRNMDWFKVQPIGGRTRDVTVGPWSCDFEPIGSLLPSSNTSTVADLLLHFFTFFATIFHYGHEVVAVHCPLNQHLSPAQARQLYDSVSARPLHVNSPLIVQDPFELSHNITKNLGKAAFSDLVRKMTLAMHILTNELSTSTGQLLKLYNDKEYVPLSSQTTKPHYIPMNIELLSQVLLKVDDKHPLALLLTQLDLTNQETEHSLYRVLSHAIALLMERDFKFQYDHVTSAPSHVTPDLVTMPMEMDSAARRDDCSPRTDQSSQTVARKRQRSNSEPDSLANSMGDAEKRSKVKVEAVLTPLDVLHAVLEPIPDSTSYQCTALENTWVGRRQKKRQSQPEDLLLALPSSPLLQVELSVLQPSVTKVSKEDSVCVVSLRPVHDHMKVHSDLWFSVFKQYLLH